MQLRTAFVILSVVAAGSLTTTCSGRSDRIASPTSPPTEVTDVDREGDVPPSTPQPSPPPAERGPVPPRPPAPPDSGSCDAAKARAAIGQPASEALLDRARAAAGASTARFLRPNQPITMEFLGSRLNLELDARDIVQSVRCG